MAQEHIIKSWNKIQEYLKIIDKLMVVSMVSIFVRRLSHFTHFCQNCSYRV